MSLSAFLHIATACLLGGAFALFVDNVVTHILDGVVEVDDEYL